MFIVFSPAWKETSGWNALNESPHLTKHWLLSQKSDPHFYCEGTQHRRRGRYRIAIFLQNTNARKRWPVTDEIIEELKAAFSLNSDEDGSEMPSDSAGIGSEVSESRTKKKLWKATKEEGSHKRKNDMPREEKSKSNPMKDSKGDKSKRCEKRTKKNKRRKTCRGWRSEADGNSVEHLWWDGELMMSDKTQILLVEMQYV